LKPTVIIFTGHYLPGYRSGGILRNVLNTVNYLVTYCDFRVITRDRDLGDRKKYEGVPIGNWTPVGNALVYYLPEGEVTRKNLHKILKETNYDVVFLTSFFDPLSVKILLIRLFNRKMFGRVIVAPFGEFAWASFSQKPIKKILFVVLARLIGLYRGVIWRVSSDFEAKDLIKFMAPSTDSIMVTGDLPIFEEPASQQDIIEVGSSVNAAGNFRVIFLSRISTEKNLDIALKILMNVRSSIVFDVYGPIENRSYWLKCQKIIESLPNNIFVRYHGVVTPGKVLKTFSTYDLFLFPTGGEAYGNVIAESLLAGTPVLISQNTPWRNLMEDGLGWDLDLSDTNKFAEIIEVEALRDEDYRNRQRGIIKKAVRKRLFDPSILESNFRLFGVCSINCFN
jgi:glycosyltransferase involved in cell wall biosynthesis